jgi:hypothetical protein
MKKQKRLTRNSRIVTDEMRLLQKIKSKIKKKIAQESKKKNRRK